MNLPPNILALLNPIEERSNALGGIERWMRTMQERWTTRDVDPPLKPYKVILHAIRVFQVFALGAGGGKKLL